MSIMESKFGCWFKCSLTRISPKLNTRVVYFIKLKKPLHLKHPQTLDEKIQWLKFNTYYKNPLVTQCADKYAVREYVKKCGCGDILNELYGVYDHVEEVPWDTLPNQFVLKWNFGCGQNLIVPDKAKLDVADAIRKLNEWYRIRDTFYLEYSEMQYKGIVPKLVCEKLIETESGGLPVDYKVYCFNGTPACVLLCARRGQMERGAEYYFFDRDWNFKRYNKRGMEAPAGFTLPKPDGMEAMFAHAEKLSKPFPFVRADFYLEKGKVTFGELTFTPCGGFDVNRLPETQRLFGSMVKL